MSITAGFLLQIKSSFAVRDKSQQALIQTKPVLGETSHNGCTVGDTFVKLRRKVSLGGDCLGRHSDSRSPMPAAERALQSGSPRQSSALVMPLCPAAPLREKHETYMAVASAGCLQAAATWSHRRR